MVLKNDILAYCCHGYLWAQSACVDVKQTKRVFPLKCVFLSEAFASNGLQGTSVLS